MYYEENKQISDRSSVGKMLGKWDPSGFAIFYGQESTYKKEDNEIDNKNRCLWGCKKDGREFGEKETYIGCPIC